MTRKEERALQAHLRVMGALESAEELIRNVVSMKDLKLTPYGPRLDINLHFVFQQGLTLKDYADALASIIGSKPVKAEKHSKA